MSKSCLTGLLVGLMMLCGATLQAQNSSSAAQVVTFGVSRTARMAASSLATMTRVQPTSSRLNVSALRTIEHMPVKITVAEKSSFFPETGMRAPEMNGRSRRTVNFQNDLRSFAGERAAYPHSPASFVFTITD